MKENLEKLLKNLGININIEGIGVDIGELKSSINYTQAEQSHILEFKIDPAVTKNQLKVHLVKPGLVKIEWPRLQPKGEEIPVE